MKCKEKSLGEVLTWTKLSKLPTYEYKGDIPWIMAIVETLKADGSESYAVAKSIDGYDFRIIKDFGSVSPIVKYEKFYPYAGIKEQYIPRVKDKEELVNYLISVYGEEKKEYIINASNEEIKRLVYKESIRLTTINRDYEIEMLNERNKYVGFLKDEDDKLKESQDKEYLEKKEELIEYQKKVAKDEGTKKQRKTRKTAK